MDKKIPCRAPGIPWQSFEDGAVLISPKISLVHELNETGAFIWAQADGTRDITEIAKNVIEEFEVEPSVATADVENYLLGLDQDGLVLWK